MIAATIAISSGLGVAAARADVDPNEIQRFEASGMSLTDAIGRAEAAVGRKAISAEFDDDGGSAGRFEVELPNADGTVTLALVDPAGGGVETRQISKGRGGQGDDDD